MNGVFCKRLGLGKTLYRDLGIYESARSVLLFGVRTISSNIGGRRPPKDKRQRDAEARQTYLVNRFGLSPKRAEKFSRTWSCLKPEKAEAVVQILKDHHFDDIQVSTLVKRTPQVICLNANKTILPKIKFFSSLGMTNKDLARTVTANPVLLTMSLENSLVPKLEVLKTLVVDNDDIVQAIKSNARIFLCNGDKNMVPNVTTLREAGVPRHALRGTIKRFASVVIQSREKFLKHFNEVIKMGIHPKESAFIQAMYFLSSTLEASKDRRIDIMKRYGMSESEIQSLFKKCPIFMINSDKNLTSKMEFLVNDMHWPPSDIVHFPLALRQSLEDRLKPRCSVMRLLQSKGRLRKNVKLSTFLRLSDEVFFLTYVARYLDEFPQLLDIYPVTMSNLELYGSNKRRR